MYRHQLKQTARFQFQAHFLHCSVQWSVVLRYHIELYPSAFFYDRLQGGLQPNLCPTTQSLLRSEGDIHFWLGKPNSVYGLAICWAVKYNDFHCILLNKSPFHNI